MSKRYKTSGMDEKSLEHLTSAETESNSSKTSSAGRSGWQKAKSESFIGEAVLIEDANPIKQQPMFLSSKLVGSTKWLALKTIEYKDEKGAERKWDIATRTTKQANVPDAVVIIPILRSKQSNNVETLLVEQYRPPIKTYALEFPAGLVDQNESPQAAALRELWEETGYVGTVDSSIPPDELCMSPGLCDETIQIVVVNVDLDDPKNINPKQNLDEGEAIAVKRLPLTTALRKTLGSSSSMPISLLYGFAIGLEMGVKYLKEQN